MKPKTEPYIWVSIAIIPSIILVVMVIVAIKKYIPSPFNELILGFLFIFLITFCVGKIIFTSYEVFSKISENKQNIICKWGMLSFFGCCGIFFSVGLISDKRNSFDEDFKYLKNVYLKHNRMVYEQKAEIEALKNYLDLVYTISPTSMTPRDSEQHGEMVKFSIKNKKETWYKKP